MREIKFRGKRLSNGEWVYGGFHKHQKITPCPVIFDGPPPPEIEYDYLIIQSGFSDWNMDRPINAITVDPETIGQFTGLRDENGQEIFEGDIVRDIDTSKVFEIMYRGHMFLRYERKPMYMFYTLDGDCLEVIGNIHDNPDLLEEECQC